MPKGRASHASHSSHSSHASHSSHSSHSSSHSSSSSHSTSHHSSAIGKLASAAKNHASPVSHSSGHSSHSSSHSSTSSHSTSHHSSAIGKLVSAASHSPSSPVHHTSSPQKTSTHHSSPSPSVLSSINKVVRSKPPIKTATSAAHRIFHDAAKEIKSFCSQNPKLKPFLPPLPKLPGTITSSPSHHHHHHDCNINLSCLQHRCMHHYTHRYNDPLYYTSTRCYRPSPFYRDTIYVPPQVVDVDTSAAANQRPPEVNNVDYYDLAAHTVAMDTDRPVVALGLSWLSDAAHAAENYDIDILCGVFDVAGLLVGMATGDNPIAFANALVHSGNNRTGIPVTADAVSTSTTNTTLPGDAENLYVDLSQIPPEVGTLVFAARVVSPNAHIASAAIRLAEISDFPKIESGQIVGVPNVLPPVSTADHSTPAPAEAVDTASDPAVLRMDLTQAELGTCNGFVIGKLYRSQADDGEHRWLFTSVRDAVATTTLGDLAGALCRHAEPIPTVLPRNAAAPYPLIDTTIRVAAFWWPPDGAGDPRPRPAGVMLWLRRADGQWVVATAEYAISTNASQWVLTLTPPNQMANTTDVTLVLVAYTLPASSGHPAVEGGTLDVTLYAATDDASVDSDWLYKIAVDTAESWHSQWPQGAVVGTVRYSPNRGWTVTAIEPTAVTVVCGAHPWMVARALNAAVPDVVSTPMTGPLSCAAERPQTVLTNRAQSVDISWTQHGSDHVCAFVALNGSSGMVPRGVFAVAVATVDTKFGTAVKVSPATLDGNYVPDPPFAGFMVGADVDIQLPMAALLPSRPRNGDSPARWAAVVAVEWNTLLAPLPEQIEFSVFELSTRDKIAAVYLSPQCFSAPNEKGLQFAMLVSAKLEGSSEAASFLRISNAAAPLYVESLSAGTLSDIGHRAGVAPSPPSVLSITTKAARNLANKDTIGKSDPYCVIRVNTLSNAELRTPTVKDSLNPTWDEAKATLTVSLTNMQVLESLLTEVVVDVYDEDPVGKDDYLGQVRVCLNDVPYPESMEAWLTLRDNGEGHKRISGDLLVRIALR